MNKNKSHTFLWRPTPKIWWGINIRPRRKNFNISSSQKLTLGYSGKVRDKKIIIVILLVATLLRFYQLGQADMITDESIISIRSIGYVDILTTENQTTPLEWFDSRPWWTYLSFHDHPPLTFITQFIFFKIFGHNVVTARLPFTLFSLASIFLIYLVAKELFKKSEIALLAAALMAINNNTVWISRIALQEAMVIFFILLCLYLFSKALKQENYFIWLGIVFGLAMLTKYTIIFLAAAIFLFILIYDKKLFLNKKLWLAVILIAILFSPVVIYNLMLYKTTGHFDLQFSYILNQDVPQWSELPGKPDIDILTRAKNIFPALKIGISPLFFGLYLISLVYLVWQYVKTRSKNYLLLLLCILFLNFLYLLTGPQRRFISMYLPLIIFCCGIFLIKSLKYLKPKKILFYSLTTLIILFFIFEIFFTYNTLFAIKPEGRVGITYSRIREDSSFWGYNNLEKFLNQEMIGKVSNIQFGLRYEFLKPYPRNYLEQAAKQKKEPVNWLFISDFNMNWYPEVWYINRRKIYLAEPWLNADTLLKTLKEEGDDYFYKQGFEKFYFVKAENTWLREANLLTKAAEIIEEQLIAQGVEPVLIKRPDGQVAFKVYIFN